MDNELTKAIDEIVAGKVLSGEGFKAMEKIRANAEELEMELVSALKTTDRNEKTISRLTEDITELNNQLAFANTRITAFTAREVAMVENETARAVAEAKASTAIDMFTAVFKPGAVRRNIQGSLPVINRQSDGSQYTSSEFVNTDETEHDE